MKKVFSHNSNLDQKENKVPERSFFSFLFLLSIVFLLCSCSSGEPFSEYASSTTWKGEGENGGTRDALEKIERYRTIRFLLVEKGEYKLAYRAVFAAAEQLGLDVRLTWTSPEHIPPLLRAGKADLAFSGNLTAPEELKRFHLEGYMLSVQGKEKRYDLFFVAQPGAQQLWQMLEKAVAASLMEERISFEDLAPEG